MIQEETQKDIKTARSKFIAMAATYCLGVFNDNYFKQVALLLAVTTGMSHLQGPATILFALPFILCSSYAGWISDKYAKKYVVISSKILELVAMIIGAAGIIFTNWPCLLAMVFLMGLQSTFFSPALNGSIPELYPESYVARANGILKLVTTLSILAGIAIAGITLDSKWHTAFDFPSSSYIVALFVIFIALMGVIASFGVYSKPASNTNRPFPKYGPVSSLKEVHLICKDRQLLIALFSDSYFYFIASIAVLTINTLGLQQLGLSQTLTSLLSVFLMLGVCAGSLFVSRIVDMKKWNRFLIPASAGMAAGLILAATSILLPESMRVAWLIGSLIVVGFAGGMFLIPITSFLQIYPSDSEKGQVLANTNFCGFIAIMCSGFVFTALDRVLSPSALMAFMGLISVGATCVLVFLKSGWKKYLLVLLSKLLRASLAVRYSIQIKGLELIEKDQGRGTVFLPNHPALIDPVLVFTTLYSKFQPRPLSDADQANKPMVRQLMKLIRPITIPDISTNGKKSRSKIKIAMEEVARCLQNNDEIVLYPAGRLYRSKMENLAGNSGVEYILNNVPECRVVLVRTTGLWGSSFGRANDNAPSIGKQLPNALKFLLANFFFFGPRRQVTIEFVEDTAIHSMYSRDKINRYLEGFYNQKAQPNTRIPSYWWESRKGVILPEPVEKKIKRNASDISEITRELVEQKITDIAGQKVQQGDRLTNDLSMDSLSLMELATWLESEFGTPFEDMSALETVEDCMLAASGKLLNSGNSEDTKVSDKWLNGSNYQLTLPKGNKLTTLFLRQAIAHPKKTILADQLSGCKTYRDLITAIFLLKPIIEKLPGDKVGIMLPASVSASIIYFATLFSGKTPVMYNWTVGVSNMAHGIDQTKTTHIISAKALYNKINEQGIKLSSLRSQWIYLEDVVAKASFSKKTSALINAHFFSKKLYNAPVPETAVILFTSGSESKPKAVPLTHENIMANLRDFSHLMSFTNQDSLLGILPPFHSLGLTGTIVLPPCLGLRTVYHANPTESVAIARVIELFKASTVIGTPTFIHGILQAGSNKQLASMQLVFTGAEKCPEAVYKKLRQVNDKATLCEGYGITECSPLVSLNTMKDNHPGTIGKIVPSVEHAVIDIETNQNVKQGERGILLLRGPNIFNGYLGDSSNKGFLEFEGKLWYQTGDFVRESKDGILSFSGRKKRFIKLGGEMISLPAIETVLLKHFTDKTENGPPLAIEATPLDEHPEVVLFSRLSITREEVNKVLKNAGLSALYNVRKVIHIDGVPVLGTGKTDYKQLKELLVLKN